MKKKKRKILLILVILLIVAAVACSGGDDDVKQPASVQGDSSANSSDKDSQKQDSSASDNDVKDEAKNDDITIAETVLYDENDIKVTATGYEDSWTGPDIKLLIENNSDHNVDITDELLSVNGYMMSGGFYAEVAAGKKSNETLSIWSSELKQAGIETVADIQFYLSIVDPESYDTIATSELLTLSTSAADYTQPVDDSGDVLYDENGIRVICKGLKQNAIWDGDVVFLIENNFGKTISVYAENVSVNGFMEDVGMWSDLRDGTRIVDSMTLLDLSDLELESTDEIESIVFNLRIVDEKDWDEIAVTDEITLTFDQAA